MRVKRCKICKKAIENPRFGQVVCSYKCSMELLKQNQKKVWRKEKREKLPELYPRRYKGLLQAEINRLAKKIDEKLGYNTCIDCGKPFGNQIDASHYANIGSHSSIRFNLHNIHSSKSDCNQYRGGNKEGYTEGISKRYDSIYLEQIKGLETRYGHIKLTSKDIAEKLKLVRKLNRDFDTFKIGNGIEARDMFNKIIGIYN